MEYARKPSQLTNTKAVATPIVRSPTPVTLSPAVQRRRQLETDLARFTATPVTAQRQAVTPVLQAAGLSRELDSGPQRVALQRSIAALSSHSGSQLQLNPQVHSTKSQVTAALAPSALHRACQLLDARQLNG